MLGAKEAEVDSEQFFCLRQFSIFCSLHGDTVIRHVRAEITAIKNQIRHIENNSNTAPSTPGAPTSGYGKLGLRGLQKSKQKMRPKEADRPIKDNILKGEEKMRPTNKIMLSIHHKNAENIFSGKKKFEIRKSAPKIIPYIVYMYETKQDGGAGAVVGCFRCRTKVKTNSVSVELTEGEKYMEHLAEQACISVEELEQYAGDKEICALDVYQPFRFPVSLPLSHFGLSKAPQSWQYLE